MIPKKESNFITPAMEQTFVELPRDPITGNPLKQPIRSDEVVLKVAIFHQEKSVKTQEFIVLASQKLSQLRDVLYCLSDHVPNGRDIKSGYFFIENEFYIDRRDRNNIDYSAEVIKFVNDPKNNKKGISGVHNSLVQIPKEAKIMEETSFNDLQLRLNYRYLYCHQGNCMHYLVFTEMRLIHNGDNDNGLWYPIRTFQGKVNRKKCQICDLYSACWVTFRDKLTPEDPSFFCDTCFRQLHYTSDGYLVQENRDFSVFRYHHD
jgi:snRNA-activating protein complex subunit 3